VATRIKVPPEVMCTGWSRPGRVQAVTAHAPRTDDFTSRFVGDPNEHGAGFRQR
jgi:hypothetical protein